MKKLWHGVRQKLTPLKFKKKDCKIIENWLEYSRKDIVNRNSYNIPSIPRII